MSYESFWKAATLIKKESWLTQKLFWIAVKIYNRLPEIKRERFKQIILLGLKEDYHSIRRGDIVEILNLSNNQIRDIQSQSCSNENPLPYIIGSRYKVTEHPDVNGGRQFECIGWNHGGFYCSLFKESQLLLYKKGDL